MPPYTKSGFTTITHFALLRIFSAHGYSDDISTYGLVSGLWTSMSALGYFIGPSVGGIAVDLSGFQWASLIIIGGQIILVITNYKLKRCFIYSIAYRNLIK